MSRAATYTEDELYAAWVASGRNATAAAKTLGMNSTTVSYHVNNKNFHQRYMADYGGVANGIRKVAFLDALTEMPRLLKGLAEIASDETATNKDRITATKAYFDILQRETMDVQEAGMTYIEAKGVWKDEKLSPAADQEKLVEEEVKLALESNIISSIEQRR